MQSSPSTVKLQARASIFNNDKSAVYFGKGVSEVIRNAIKDELQVHNETLNEKYLGLPSNVGRHKNDAFSYLKDRVWKRLLGWMEKTLSGALQAKKC